MVDFNEETIEIRNEAFLLGCVAKMSIPEHSILDIHMQGLHAEERHGWSTISSVSTLTWDLRARTSTLLAELFMMGT